MPELDRGTLPEKPPLTSHGWLVLMEEACAPDHPEDSIEGLNEN